MIPPPSQSGTGRRAPARGRRVPGELPTATFLAGLPELARPHLPAELQDFQARQQGSLAKLWYDDPAAHFEVWVHRSRGRIEVGLHFESRDAARNAQMLAYVADELFLVKATLGDGVEAEPWDKGWARVYHVLPLEPLAPDFQARLAEHLALWVETLEPLRRDAGYTSASHAGVKRAQHGSSALRGGPGRGLA